MAPITFLTNGHCDGLVNRSTDTLVKRFGAMGLMMLGGLGGGHGGGGGGGLDGNVKLFLIVFFSAFGGTFVIILGILLLPDIINWCCRKNRERKRKKAERLALKQRQLEARNLINLKKDNGFSGYAVKPGKQLISAAENGYVDPVKVFDNNSSSINNKRPSRTTYNLSSTSQANTAPRSPDVSIQGEGWTLPEPFLNDHYDMPPLSPEQIRPPEPARTTQRH